MSRNAPQAPKGLKEASQLVAAGLAMAESSDPAERRLARGYASLLKDAGYRRAARDIHNALGNTTSKQEGAREP